MNRERDLDETRAYEPVIDGDYFTQEEDISTIRQVENHDEEYADHEDDLPERTQRSTYHVGINRFLNNGILITAILLICVLLIAFLL